jgi:hypothetical protein
MNKFDKLTPEQDRRLQRYELKAGMTSLQRIYIDGNIGFAMGPKYDQTDMTDTTWVALVDLATGSWQRREKMDWVEIRNLVYLVYDDEPPEPETHQDPTLWENSDKYFDNKTGEPKKIKPWRFIWELPMQNTKTKRLAVYRAENEFQRAPISPTIAAFRTKHRRPIIMLLYVDGIEKGKKIKKPVFDVIDYDEGDADLISLANDQNSAAKPNTNNDFNDGEPRDAHGIKTGDNISTGTANGSKGKSDMDDDIPF